MGLDRYAKNLLEDKTCDRCKHSYFCNVKVGKKYNTCSKWEEGIDIEGLIMESARDEMLKSIDLGVIKKVCEQVKL